MTGRCPECGTKSERHYIARVRWDCPNPEYGWLNDKVESDRLIVS
ncbi:hypothetical protein [Dendronalium sp. ChiSLP03b]|nr:hypothetical protein [Dendronalium sp. ChiSLP03b]MDZ8205805.1 hypothetical protein [Dendronalium sp. ChiSLP03b]